MEQELKTITGDIIAALLFQVAALKAENGALRSELEKSKEPAEEPAHPGQ